ncbi:hypothetical protein ACOSP7_019656 [Xanthoceras sorbifolium]
MVSREMQYWGKFLDPFSFYLLYKEEAALVQASSLSLCPRIETWSGKFMIVRILRTGRSNYSKFHKILHLSVVIMECIWRRFQGCSSLGLTMQRSEWILKFYPVYEVFAWRQVKVWP